MCKCKVQSTNLMAVTQWDDCICSLNTQLAVSQRFRRGYHYTEIHNRNFLSWYRVAHQLQLIAKTYFVLFVYFQIERHSSDWKWWWLQWWRQWWFVTAIGASGDGRVAVHSGGNRAYTPHRGGRWWWWWWCWWWWWSWWQLPQFGNINWGEV